MKQSAVEWLVEELTTLGHNFKLYKKEIEQAKEMEKEQIENAFENGDTSSFRESAEQYYKETFNK